ncbi:hypothetical protein EPN52_09935 [bacterium]|nr:MAG: hypothetical protein EPN52_09935 [bacterium]
MIPSVITTTPRRPAPADGAVARRAATFDQTTALRAEILREVDVLEQLSVNEAKRDDALLRKYIEMI